MRGGRGEALLENAGGEAAGAALGGLDPVEFGERGAEGFFAQGPRAGFERRDAHVGVEGGRCGDEDEVGPEIAECGGVVGEEGGDLVALAKRPEARGVDLDRADELHAAQCAFDGTQVGFGDAAGADQEGAIGLAHGEEVL